MKVTVNGVISRGVKSCTVDGNGHLIFIMTDNSTVDLGIVVGTGIESIYFKETDSNGNNVYTITLTDGTTAEFTANRGPQGIQGIQGETGEQGVSVTNYQLVSGNHAPGTYDTYRMTLSDGTTFDCKVWNGANGEGSGDMLASIYDSNGKATDIFNYVDNKIASDVSGQINAHNESKTAHNDIRTGKQDKITASGLLKGDGAGGVTNAVAGTDYQTPLTTEGAQTLGIDSTPTSGSRNLITSGAVYTSLQNKADASSVYTKTEADTLLANVDPRQWGLGDVGKAITDCNSATESGIYRFDNADNSPFSYATMLVLERYGGGICTQIAFCNGGETTGVIAIRNNNGVWEYVNPPMQLGVEYRTTERYLGKPVYAMAVDFGNLPNATTKEITVSGVSSPNKAVSVFGYTSDYKTIPTFSYGWGSISTISDAIALDADAYPDSGLRIHVATQQNRSDATAVVVVKYTKSTD